MQLTTEDTESTEKNTEKTSLKIAAVFHSFE
jgi:hypothetical protein